MSDYDTFAADMAEAIVLEAAAYGYIGKPGLPNKPVAIGLHTPEEPADDDPSTPAYFHNLFNRAASTTYFLAKQKHPNARTGKSTRWFQMVPERAGAYGNALQGKPRPAWSDPNGALGGHLNLQTISIELEGFANSIHLTMKPSGPMWADLIAGMADIARRNPGVKLADTFGHYQVSTLRTDPGVLNISRVVREAKAALTGGPPAEEDDMTPEEHSWLANVHRWLQEMQDYEKGAGTPNMKGTPQPESILGRLYRIERAVDALPGSGKDHLVKIEVVK